MLAAILTTLVLAAPPAVGQVAAEQARDAAASASAADVRAMSPPGALARGVVHERVGEEPRVTRPGRHSDQSCNGTGLPLRRLDTVPVVVVSEVRASGEGVRPRRTQSGGRFDPVATTRRRERLLALVESIRGQGSAADLELARILGPLHRVPYATSDPHHPGAGVASSPRPGLSPVPIQVSGDPMSDRYRFALTAPARERNRLLEVLDVVLEEARRVEVSR